MKFSRILVVLFFIGANAHGVAQEMPADMSAALKADDATKLAIMITKDNVSNCYTDGNWDYSVLSQTIGYNGKKCFDLLIEKGADINKECNGYVPHAIE